MNKHRTLLLAVLVFAALAVAAMGYVRFDKLRGDALASARDLAVCRQQLATLDAANASPGGLSPVSIDSANLHQRLRGAAVAAGIPEAQQTSVEPGQPTRVPDTDYQEFPVFLRLDGVTMKQLATYLHELARRDPGSRAKSIELAPQPGDSAAEKWTADITVAYLVYTPRVIGKEERTQSRP